MGDDTYYFWHRERMSPEDYVDKIVVDNNDDDNDKVRDGDNNNN